MAVAAQRRCWFGEVLLLECRRARKLAWRQLRPPGTAPAPMRPVRPPPLTLEARREHADVLRDLEDARDAGRVDELVLGLLHSLFMMICDWRLVVIG